MGEGLFQRNWSFARRAFGCLARSRISRAEGVRIIAWLGFIYQPLRPSVALNFRLSEEHRWLGVWKKLSSSGVALEGAGTRWLKTGCSEMRLKAVALH